MFDRDVALTAAMRLFWRKGFSATSLTDLTSAMGISPPSLYAAFGSKEALYESALEHYTKHYKARSWERFNKVATLREAITHYLMDSPAIHGVAGNSEDPPGCMLALSSVGEEGNAVLGKIVRNARAQALQKLEERFEKGVSEGELLPEQAAGLARFFLAVQGGLSLQARDGASYEELVAIVQKAILVLDTHSGQLL
ncbi:TetR/AcrR family transcriptional regulator [Mangrovibacter plantisponsor]|uniref:TetR family transcriptional regulator n=1 Tax=Mangrovibacter plantisponsor TaxID=451513 RepID=A0A317PWP3_9ENTR|nr:TetR/AcrR family transcriptional regulator [Mangrovibacter plantisponsor]PWW07581.1 TetR family transcriptional regulator [Mangrovibacter plantisponsor]